MQAPPTFSSVRPAVRVQGYATALYQALSRPGVRITILYMLQEAGCDLFKRL